MTSSSEKFPGQQPQQSFGSLLKQEAEDARRRANVQPGSTLMTPKKNPGIAGQQTRLTTNIYRLDMQKKLRFFQYEVTIIGIRSNNTELILTNRTSQDYLLVERRDTCRAVITVWQRDNLNIDRGLYYDQHRILFSLREIIMPQAGQTWTFSVLQLKQVSDDIGNGFESFRLGVKPAGSSYLGDYSHIGNDAAAIDRRMEQFMDIATSQEIFGDRINYCHYSTSQIYLMNPSKHGYRQEDCPHFPSNHSFMGIGLQKGVRAVQENSEGITSGLVVKVKKSPFHINAKELVLAKAQQLLSSQDIHATNCKQLQEALERFVTGIYVQTIYGKEQSFVIWGLSEKDAHNQKFSFDNTEVSVAQYFFNRYGITLEHPELPLLIWKKGSREEYFPMELCQIHDYQRVKGLQQTRQQIQELFRHAAIPPAKLIDETNRLKDALQLTRSNYMLEAGLHLHERPMEVDARVLPPPTIQLTTRITDKPTQPACEWGRHDGTPYLIPTNCQKWAALALYGKHRDKDQLTIHQWNIFLNTFQQRLLQKGVHYPKPESIECLPVETEHLEELFEQYLANGFEFVLVAHPDSADEIHHFMKYRERQTELVTQGLKISTVHTVNAGKTLALTNIVHKTNMKMGGLNYGLIPDSEEMRTLFGTGTLIIGIATNHPMGGVSLPPSECLSLYPSLTKTHSPEQLAKGGNGGNGSGGNGNGRNGGRTSGANNNGRNGQNGQNGNGSAQTPKGPFPISPSVVGYSANIGTKHAFEFIGDFHNQRPLREEKIGVIETIVKHCTSQFKHVRGQFPRQIFIYRSGCAEGFFQHILKNEVPLIKAVLSGIGCEAKLTVLVVNKLQPVRLFASQINAQARAADQNIQPGTVVDTGIVHPKWTEFFLNSHRALHGTASTPRYNVLLDENELGMDTLQKLTYYLCFGHQIVYSPTSLPTPVHIATEYAKRGRNLFNSWADKDPVNSLEYRGIREFTELDAILNYQNTNFLKNLRVNA